MLGHELRRAIEGLVGGDGEDRAAGNLAGGALVEGAFAQSPYEVEIPQEFWLPQPPKLNKKGLLNAINSGWAVPGAVLSNSKISLAVRTK